MKGHLNLNLVVVPAETSKMKVAREAAGMSRAQLARAAGMHASDIGKIESGIILAYQSQAEKIANALGVKVKDLWVAK